MTDETFVVLQQYCSRTGGERTVLGTEPTAERSPVHKRKLNQRANVRPVLVFAVQATNLAVIFVTYSEANSMLVTNVETQTNVTTNNYRNSIQIFQIEN